MLNKITDVLRTRGMRGLAHAVIDRAFRQHAPSFKSHARLFAGKRGLEIGGPSEIFSDGGLFPVYPLVGELDNCNFSPSTIWEGNIASGPTFHFSPDSPAGSQYILEATNLASIDSDSRDFVLSSHTLEHTANPLKALGEWKRVLKRGGILVLVVPERKGTFDHKRPVTSLAHLIMDLQRDTSEADLTHLPEILALHDLIRDPLAGSLEAFTDRSTRNLENRGLHQHVFDPTLVREVINYSELKLRALESLLPFHILSIAEKP